MPRQPTHEGEEGRSFGEVKSRRRELAERHEKLHGVPGPSSLRVSDRSERWRGEDLREQIFINVGGRAVVPHMPGVEEVPYFNNSSIMDVDFLPRHLIIIGGGYIGLEFAQMYRRFGSEVTIVETSPYLARREDEDVSTAIREFLEQEGVNVRLNATCIGFSKRGKDALTRVDCKDGDPEVTGSHLLAVGRCLIPTISA